MFSRSKHVLELITDDVNISEACSVSRRKQRESEEYPIEFMRFGSIVLRSIEEVYGLNLLTKLPAELSIQEPARRLARVCDSRTMRHRRL